MKRAEMICCLFISLTLHLLIFMMFSKLLFKEDKIGKPVHHVINIYLANFAKTKLVYDSTKKSLQYKKDKNNKQQQPNTLKQKTIQKKLAINKNVLTAIEFSEGREEYRKRQALKDIKQNITRAISLNSLNGKVDPFLLQLHNAILNAEEYPEQSQILGQKGRVTLEFLMSRAGDITHIKILQSSGFSLLDEAAVAAIHSINPYQPAQSFLKSSQVFTVSLQFI